MIPGSNPAALPGYISLLMRPMPLWPLEQLLSALAARLAEAHPAILTRLGPHADKIFGIVATDLPFAFLLQPAAGRSRLKLVRTLSGIGTDACIRGTLPSLLALAEGRMDGDALFFSRALSVEGDVEAVLALRNAIDDNRIDIVQEAMAPLGPFSSSARALFGVAAEHLARARRRHSAAAGTWN